MECLHELCLYSLLAFTILIHASTAKSDFSYPCVGTSPCVKKFMLQVWGRDFDFFLLNIADEDFRTNCTQAQTCLTDVTGGGGSTEVSDVTTAAVSFIYDVCSRDRQRQFNSSLRQCILNDRIRTKAENFHRNWMTDRDANLAIIANPNQITKFCLLLKVYLLNIQETLTEGGCADAAALNWCLKIVRENVYEKYGAFCPCYGNCDCKNLRSTSPINRGNGTGAAYMMLVFGFFFLVGAVLVKKTGKIK